MFDRLVYELTIEEELKYIIHIITEGYKRRHEYLNLLKKGMAKYNSKSVTFFEHAKK